MYCEFWLQVKYYENQFSNKLLWNVNIEQSNKKKAKKKIKRKKSKIKYLFFYLFASIYCCSQIYVSKWTRTYFSSQSVFIAYTQFHFFFLLQFFFIIDSMIIRLCYVKFYSQYSLSIANFYSFVYFNKYHEEIKISFFSMGNKIFYLFLFIRSSKIETNMFSKIFSLCSIQSVSLYFWDFRICCCW